VPPSVFVSYSRHQSEWVWERLVSELRVGGAKILIDRDQFEAARAVYRQMDDVQDRADLNILVFSPEYLASEPCQHEMKRAIARDPKFEKGVTIPVLRFDCTLPSAIKRPNPLYVDLRDDAKPDPWDLLLKTCKLELGAAAPEWLPAHDQVRLHLDRGESVNLVVTGQARWRPLIAETIVDLLNESGQRQLNATMWASALNETVVRGHNVFHELLVRESRIEGELEYLQEFRRRETQPPPGDNAIARSLTRRMLVVPDGDNWRLRAPLFRRWLQRRG
jgi:hypothetical protein